MCPCTSPLKARASSRPQPRDVRVQGAATAAAAVASGHATARWGEKMLRRPHAGGKQGITSRQREKCASRAAAPRPKSTGGARHGARKWACGRVTETQAHKHTNKHTLPHQKAKPGSNRGCGCGVAPRDRLQLRVPPRQVFLWEGCRRRGRRRSQTRPRAPKGKKDGALETRRLLPPERPIRRPRTAQGAPSIAPSIAAATSAARPFVLLAPHTQLNRS